MGIVAQMVVGVLLSAPARVASRRRLYSALRASLMSGDNGAAHVCQAQKKLCTRGMSIDKGLCAPIVGLLGYQDVRLKWRIELDKGVLRISPYSQL